jgi:hypothetical protein
MDEVGNSSPFLEQNSNLAIESIPEIYLQDPSPEEARYVQGLRERVIDQHDIGGVGLYENLWESLKELDTAEGWAKTKEAARTELSQIPSDFLEKILGLFGPLIKSLPAGHGKGHMLRDTINLVGMLNDPKFNSEKIDEVELIVGILGAVFHDDGNSIVERYKDNIRVGAHAEVGAVLFGEAAQGIIPENLLKLTQYVIASHTHYPREREVEIAEGNKFIARAFDDTVGPHGREAVWLARQADRRDTSNFAHLIRDMVVRIQPIQDYNKEAESFEKRRKDQEHFLVSYGLSPEIIDDSLIGHEIRYCRSVFMPNRYNSQDSEFFTMDLMTPGIGDFMLFLSVVAPDKRDGLLADIGSESPKAAESLKADLSQYAERVEKYSLHPLEKEDIATAVGEFKHLCRVVEPAPNLEEELEIFETRFSWLGAEDQQKWARGMLFMSDVLFSRWRDRLAKSVTEDIHLGSKIASRNITTQQQFEEIGDHLLTIARQIVASMNRADIATS